MELFRTNLDKIIESEKKRFKNPKNAEMVFELDKKWREAISELQDLRRQQKIESKKIKDLKDAEKKEAIKTTKVLKGKIEDLEKLEKQYKAERKKYRYIVGNILHDSVPIGEKEDHNEIIRNVGDKTEFSFEPVNHVELVELIDGADTQKASEVVGSRFYYLKGDLVNLNLALMRFAMDLLQEKGYMPMWTPFSSSMILLRLQQN